MTTVTLFTVTSRVCPEVRSMFFNLTYLDLLFLLRESLLEDFEPLAPGNWICVAACWALTSAEFSRGFRVDVPKKEVNRISIRQCWFKSLINCFHCCPTWTINLLILFAHQYRRNIFHTVCSCWMMSENIFAIKFWGFPKMFFFRNVDIFASRLMNFKIQRIFLTLCYGICAKLRFYLFSRHTLDIWKLLPCF